MAGAATGNVTSRPGGVESVPASWSQTRSSMLVVSSQSFRLMTAFGATWDDKNRTQQAR